MTANKLDIRQKGFAVFALVFFLGVQTMILELTLPRLLATAFGNTLYCWTAAIGEVLAALAIGYQAGGLISSRNLKSNPNILVKLSFVSAGFVVLTGALGDKLVETLSTLSIIQGPLVLTLLLAVPSVIAGAAALPLSVGMISDNNPSGKKAGQVYALSTLGSVIGVLVTGYLLLPFLGIRGALFTGAGCVFFTLILFRGFSLGATGLAIVCLITFGYSQSHSEEVLLDKSNGFHRIRVLKNKADESIRLLFLDNTLEGAVKLGSSNPGVPYQRAGARIALQLSPLDRCFFLGGGSFSIPRFVKERSPETTVDVAEIDRDVVEASREFLELGHGSNIHIGDGRRVLSQSEYRYDLIMNDAFHGLRAIPFHLLTREFNGLVAEKLTDNGVYCLNVMGDFEKSRLVASIVKTLRQNFKYITRMDSGKRGAGNYWLLAANHHTAMGDPVALLPDRGMVLTDNHAPVEYLVATDVVKEKRDLLEGS